MKKLVVFPVIVVCILHVSCSSEVTIDYNSFEIGSGTNDNVEGTSLLERMDYHDVPGLSIAVVKNGKLSWAKGYGISSAATGQKVDVNTLFQAGSVSKPVAALAALKLVDEGKIELDTDVNIYLNDWKIDENKFTETEKVTLRRLLTHSAGFKLHGFPGYKRSKDLPSLLSILDGEGNTPKIVLNSVPGSRWKYSGGGYTVMQKLIEDVSDLTLDEYMDQHVFDPLDMANSTFRQPLPSMRSTNASAGHFHGKVMEGSWHNYPELAAAGLWSTPTDLAKLCIEIHEILAKKQNGMMCFAHQGNAIIIMANTDRCKKLIAEIQRSITAFHNWEIETR